jgi:uncharacterized protein YndB with AHSA1/START domain
MTIDIAKKIGATTRQISRREHNGQAAYVLVAARVYDTDQNDLWDALTNADRIPKWFLPITGDLRLGGSYQLEGNAGGDITACEPPEHLALTWGMHGQVSWVDLKLSARAEGRTELRLEHVAHVPPEMWDEFGPGAVGIGWDLALLGLDLHYTEGTAVDPKAAAAWMASDEGKNFIRRSSDAWCEASVASGTDRQAARAAADKVAAMYTGG